MLDVWMCGCEAVTKESCLSTLPYLTFHKTFVQAAKRNLALTANITLP